MAVYDLRAPGHGVLLPDLLQLVHDDLPDPGGLSQRVLQVGDLLLQVLGLPDPLEDVFLVDVAQLDLRHILRLDLVDAEADHQVGDHLGLLLGFPDDGDGLVDVQQNALQAQQQVQLVLFAAEHEIHPPPHAVRAPGGPLAQDLAHPHDPGHPGDEDVEVAADGVLQRGQPEELGHQLLRVHAALQVDGQLQAG